MDKIRLLIVEDHRALRQELHSVLSAEADIEVVGAAANGWEALQMAQTLAPDVVLMDIVLPRMDGLEATRRITQACPGMKVLIFPFVDSEEYALAAIEAGAAGFLPKGVSGHKLLEAIRTVHRQELFLCPSCAKGLIEAHLKARRKGLHLLEGNACA